MHDFAIFIPTGDAATAAFCDARAAALCVRGAPLSGCQLRGVVEALRPGLLAAHPGTWGAAVRRAEEREQRGEPEDDRLMVRGSASMLRHRLQSASDKTCDKGYANAKRIARQQAPPQRSVFRHVSQVPMQLAVQREKA